MFTPHGSGPYLGVRVFSLAGAAAFVAGFFFAVAFAVFALPLVVTFAATAFLLSAAIRFAVAALRSARDAPDFVVPIVPEPPLRRFAFFVVIFTGFPKARSGSAAPDGSRARAWKERRSRMRVHRPSPV